MKEFIIPVLELFELNYRQEEGKFLFFQEKEEGEIEVGQIIGDEITILMANAPVKPKTGKELTTYLLLNGFELKREILEGMGLDLEKDLLYNAAMLTTSMAGCNESAVRIKGKGMEVQITGFKDILLSIVNEPYTNKTSVSLYHNKEQWAEYFGSTDDINKLLGLLLKYEEKFNKNI
jgi:hypothetical protein